MAFVKGQVANPNGRPKGSRNKRDLVAEALTQQAISEGLTPLDFFLSVLRSPDAKMCDRRACAIAAAPYVHRKMPIAIEDSNTPFRTLDITTLQGLSLEELRTLATLMEKAALADVQRDARPPKMDPRITQAPSPTAKAAAKKLLRGKVTR